MRKIVLSASVSLDGFFEGPNGELDWHNVDDELHQHFNDWLRENSVFLEGRRTYELMEGFWPTADQDPETPPVMVEFAGIWREMPKIVFSRTLEQVGPNATIVRDVDPDEIRRLKQQPGGDMSIGGADLASTFLEHDLIDDFRLYMVPVTIGRGNRLFREAYRRTQMRLVETHTFGNGTVLLHYERA